MLLRVSLFVYLLQVFWTFAEVFPMREDNSTQVVDHEGKDEYDDIEGDLLCATDPILAFLHRFYQLFFESAIFLH